MNFLMTAAPLAMRLCGLPQEAANLGLQWHVIAMYAPSFFTGRLITRFGAPRVVAAGLALIAAAAVAGLLGQDVAHFWWSLILLGLGWNFGFVGASAMVLECHRPEERTRVQSLNDFIVFGLMALGSFASGGLLTRQPRPDPQDLHLRSRDPARGRGVCVAQHGGGAPGARRRLARPGAPHL